MFLLYNFDIIVQIKVVLKKNKILQSIIYFKKSKKRKIFVDIVQKEKIKLILKDCCLVDNILYIKHYIYKLSNKKFRIYVVKDIYNNLSKDYVNCFLIYKKVSKYYYWFKITNITAQYIYSCYIYKRTKSYKQKKQNLLKSLLISNCYWHIIIVYFIISLFICLQHNRSYQYIIVVIDCLLKKKKFIVLNLLFVKLVI